MAGTRAANGESTIYQDKDGRWHGYVSMGLKRDGVRDRRHVSAARRADVVRGVRALERKRDEGLAVVAGKAPTVEAWLNQWGGTTAARKVRARTLVSYMSTIKLHLAPTIGHHRLDRLQPEHLESLYADLEERGLAGTTVLRVHRVLSGALQIALQRGLVARNVATLVEPPTVRRAEVSPFTSEEARRVLAACGRDGA